MTRAKDVSSAETERTERVRLEEFDKRVDHDAGILSTPTLLVAEPTEITREATKKIQPWTLYELLCLDAFSADHADLVLSAHAQAEKASQEAKCLQLEHERWITVGQHIRGAIDAIGARTPRLVFPFGLYGTDDYSAATMLDALRRIEDDARDFASRVMRFELQPAQENSKRSSWDVAAVTRARARMLQQRLRWKPHKIADLIVASEKDWSPAPVKLDSELRDNPKLVRKRFRDLLRSGPDRRR